MLIPKRLAPGDKVRFVSPASTPDRDTVQRQARILESWGLKVDFGEHAFSRFHYLAGSDEQRLADLNAAFSDPEIRAIFATRGGKGSYRIADRLDFAAVRRDPKFLVGFSDITVLHLKLWRECRVAGVHGALMPDASGEIAAVTVEALRTALMSHDPIALEQNVLEPTSALTTRGVASGPLVGGNLDMVATGAGWALPKLDGAILLLEAVDKYVGEIDRQLTMLRKAGHLDGVAGFAIGQFTGFRPSKALTVVDLMRDHLGHFSVPILGGLPLGHGCQPVAALIGGTATIDADAGRLRIERTAG
jgi:muramoyltetrapeptide carboxypeptidase